MRKKDSPLLVCTNSHYLTSTVLEFKWTVVLSKTEVTLARMKGCRVPADFTNQVLIMSLENLFLTHLSSVNQSQSSEILNSSTSPNQFCSQRITNLESVVQYRVLLRVASVGDSLPPPSCSGTKPSMSCAWQPGTGLHSTLPQLHWSDCGLE